MDDLERVALLPELLEKLAGNQHLNFIIAEVNKELREINEGLRPEEAKPKAYRVDEEQLPSEEPATREPVALPSEPAGSRREPMARDILSEYGNDVSHPQAPRATSGGVTESKDLPYSPPQGPSNINDPKTPGIHGTNYGNKVNQGQH